MGKKFNKNNINKINIGTTTQKEINLLFGTPWRIGITDGQKTWTYGEYKFSIFGDNLVEDLIIKFDKIGNVTSYKFNTNDHNE